MRASPIKLYCRGYSEIFLTSFKAIGLNANIGRFVIAIF